MKTTRENILIIAMREKATVGTAAAISVNKLNSLLNEKQVDNHNNKDKKNRHHLHKKIRRTVARSSLTQNDLIYIVDFFILTQSNHNFQRQRFRPMSQGI